MAGVARPLALPRGWPRGLRSAAVHAVSIAEFALTTALGWAAQSLNPRLRLRAELERLRNEVLLLREEIRIKDARMQHIEAQKRPHYPPTARLAILELRAARNWSLAQIARIFLVTPVTITSWTARLNEEGPDALVRLPDPVNSSPTSSPTSSGASRPSAPPWARSRSPRPSPVRGFTSARQRSSGCCGRHHRRSPAELSR